jgi:hypothetical protein
MAVAIPPCDGQTGGRPFLITFFFTVDIQGLSFFFRRYEDLTNDQYGSETSASEGQVFPLLSIFVRDLVVFFL